MAEATDDLGEYPLEEDLHHDGRTREDGRDDLAFLIDRHSDLVIQ